ncbi:hypothetical protein F6X40_09950 [Paraburkholderia sp. UCT31]|uniref:hypothetical protein n=1 Tax=Paraburkholderia sp. UCT31 TaxID=2615209 RepID=UPI001654C9C2|nr:hypothetical protein [Paraburkholderia sp. UCT31]MBC8737129.1 hypothetical protein [Paraburkholderia sp. UCT31]
MENRRSALNSYLKSRQKLANRSLLGAALAVAATIPAFFAAWFIQGKPNILAAFSLVALAEAFLVPNVLLIIPISQRKKFLHELEPVPAENTAELMWLLAHVPESTQLASTIERDPRPYVWGELVALRAAYQAAKV